MGTFPSRASGIRSVIISDLGASGGAGSPGLSQLIHPSIQPTRPTVKLAQAWRLSGPYSELFHLGSHDKQLSNVISSN